VALPTFDLVVATVDRTAEPAALLDSLARQTHAGFRVLLVDQNDDDRLDPLVAREGLRVERVRSARGLARARNAGLALVEADLVGFPDDDCAYPADLLERVAARFAADPGLDGLTGRTADARGGSSARWPRQAAALGRDTVWHGGNSATTFLRAGLVRRVGSFDERLGLGAGTPWASGEDTDYLIRALDLGAVLTHDPEVVVLHELRGDDARTAQRGRREGAALGFLLGKHRYPARVVARMLVRPAGGAVAALLRLDGGLARYHAATLAGRARGWVAGRSA
jgi:glycosyltransferase involved in cell wall biosynthesis